jgi:TRAP-type C4-dicarboxylate transport system permease small subunit
VNHGHGLDPALAQAGPGHAPAGARPGWFDRLNALLLKLSMCAMVLTALVLTYAVVSRYFFKAPTDWQDEASVFMLVGVTFSCSAWVQSQRGHIGIEALSTALPPLVNAARLFMVDLLSFLFCGFFAWKSWTLFHEAWVDGQTTSSTFAPPLWIPYSMMAAGMTLLTLQILVQLAAHLAGERKSP